jgi:hypothetical protein
MSRFYRTRQPLQCWFQHRTDNMRSLLAVMPDCRWDHILRKQSPQHYCQSGSGRPLHQHHALPGWQHFRQKSLDRYSLNRKWRSMEFVQSEVPVQFQEDGSVYSNCKFHQVWCPLFVGFKHVDLGLDVFQSGFQPGSL